MATLSSSSVRRVRLEPLDSLLQGYNNISANIRPTKRKLRTGVKRGKLEVRSNESHQFFIGSGLAILPIIFGFVLKDRLSWVLEDVDDRICELLDGDFVLLIHYTGV